MRRKTPRHGADTFVRKDPIAVPQSRRSQPSKFGPAFGEVFFVFDRRVRVALQAIQPTGLDAPDFLDRFHCIWGCLAPRRL
jgi:hypothetical protein